MQKTILSIILSSCILLGCASPKTSRGLTEDNGTSFQSESIVTPTTASPQITPILQENPLKISGVLVSEAGNKIKRKMLADLISTGQILKIVDYPHGGSDLHEMDVADIAQIPAWDDKLAQKAWVLDNRLYAFIPDKYKAPEMSLAYVAAVKNDRMEAWWRLRHYVPLDQVNGILQQLAVQ